MMRKLLTSVSAVAIAGFAAFGVVKAANLPLFSNIALQEPSQELAALNALVQAINSGVTGNFAFVPGPTGNVGGGTTTVNNTLASALVPTGLLVAAGQAIRARCTGIASVTTTAKVGITYGRGANVSLESFNTAGNGPNWDVELNVYAATNPVTANYTYAGRGFAGSATGNAGTVTPGSMVAVSGGNDTTVTDNNALNSVPITCVLYGGVGTGQVTMENFAVEILR